MNLLEFYGGIFESAQDWPNSALIEVNGKIPITFKKSRIKLKLRAFENPTCNFYILFGFAGFP